MAIQNSGSHRPSDEAPDHSVRDPFGDNTPAGPAKRSKAGFALRAIGAVLVALLVGGGVGLAAGAVNEPPGSKVAPPFPEEFPHADQRYLSGVTVSLVADEWLKGRNSWTCEKRETSSSIYEAEHVLDCDPPGTGWYVRVSIEYDADDKVKAITASCSHNPKKDCAELLPALAFNVFRPQPELQKEAQKWVTANAVSDKGITFGNLRLDISLQPNEMVVTPAV